jgi:AAA ATPase domain
VSIDWQLLAPHRPVGERYYVEPPDRGAKDIVNRIVAGTGVVLVGGPTGIGKSTELRRAAALLHGDHVACLVPLDLLHNIRKLDVDQLCLRMMERLANVATEALELELSPQALQLAKASEESDDGEVFAAVVQHQMSPDDALQNLLEEVRRLASPRPIVFLLDGLEKLHETKQAMELFGLLGTLPSQVRIVVVIPWQVAFGGQSDALIRPGEWFFALRALEVEASSSSGTQFLLAVLRRRLNLPAISSQLLPMSGSVGDHLVALAAAEWSGGVPRTFLQLMADAGTYARLRGHDGWPEHDDLNNAIADLEDSFRRLLLPGDTEAIISAENTDGRELELSRKVRFMAHGILLEKMVDRRPVIRIHPLARRSIKESTKVAR